MSLNAMPKTTGRKSTHEASPDRKDPRLAPMSRPPASPAVHDDAVHSRLLERRRGREGPAEDPEETLRVRGGRGREPLGYQERRAERAAHLSPEIPEPAGEEEVEEGPTSHQVVPATPPAAADLPADPIVRSQVRAGEALLDAGRTRIAKRRAELYRNIEEEGSPNGERRSAAIVERVELVPLAETAEDPGFPNMRLPPTPEEEQMLEASMRAEGLKVPIEVIPSPDDRLLYVRAGFRRRRAALKLGWKQIPAIVLPKDTPIQDEFWVNIIENAVRNRLTTYETALAAKTMRHKFKVKPREFAVRAGLSETYVLQLLRCIDKLPETIIDEWKQRAPIPVSQLDRWTSLTEEEALSAMRAYCNRNPKIVGDWRPPPKFTKHPARMATSAGLDRMMRLRFAIEVARKLDEPTRRLCLEIVDFCSGARQDVAGVLREGEKLRMYQSRRREDLAETAPEDIDDLWLQPQNVDRMGEEIMKMEQELEECRKKYEAAQARRLVLPVPAPSDLNKR